MGPNVVAVHPRMGGEQLESAIYPGPVIGSSPHGRGTAQFCRNRPPKNRFIPAWAGNRIALFTGGAGIAVHPRMGGEQYDRENVIKDFHGSSPHGRGTEWLVAPATGDGRFIPAWAGNRLCRGGRHCQRPVHPRMGGEQHGLRPVVWTSCGSSPHGRGTVQAFPAHPLNNRFIPAWAGNRLSADSTALSSAVHPRMGGEQQTFYQSHAILSGSSPHGRGTELGDDLERLDSRFIPAWAGNSGKIMPVSRSSPVHPRMGGEQSCGSVLAVMTAGSSPHGRGTVFRLFYIKNTPRFIPAWAGNRL